jgi:hypothetical protein
LKFENIFIFKIIKQKFDSGVSAAFLIKKTVSRKRGIEEVFDL